MCVVCNGRGGGALLLRCEGGCENCEIAVHTFWYAHRFTPPPPQLPSTPELNRTPLYLSPFATPMPVSLHPPPPPHSTSFHPLILDCTHPTAFAPR